MKVLEIKNVSREDGCIYYFRKFTGEAVVQLPADTLDTPIAFSIESNPLGSKDIQIEFKQSINYPVLPVKKALQEFILTRDSEGKLP
mgnify:CR=1 FL=1